MNATALHGHIAAWRSTQVAFTPTGLTPWFMESQLAGWVEPTLVARLIASDVFVRSATGLMLAPGIGGPISKSHALQHLAEQLRDEGLISGWRNERHDFVDDWGRVRCSIERAAFRTLGLRARAVHVNGYVGENGLWLARRANNKPTDPGMLDNLAAGLVSAGETPAECMMRELAEEAGVPAYIAKMARPAGLIHSQRRVPGGVHDELLCCFDLDLPSDFVPINTDGEVSDFLLATPNQVATRLAELTPDAAVVTSEWLGRWVDGDT